jgi:hypothetical protein
MEEKSGIHEIIHIILWDEKGELLGICHDLFTDCSEIVPDHISTL